MSGRFRPWTSRAALVFLLLLAAEAWILFGERFGEPAHHPAPRETVPSLEIARGVLLSQTFLVGADGLSALTFHPVTTGRVPEGTVELSLFVGRDTLLARSRFPAREVFATDTFTWRFPTVESSAGGVFTFWFVLDSPPGLGGSLAVGPPGYADGELYLAGRPQWGDLKFATRAEWARTIDVLRRMWTGSPVAFGLTLAAGLLALNAAIAAFASAVIGDAQPALTGAPRTSARPS